MKTAISVPDDTFARASLRAQELGVSRSEFFSAAAAHYLDELDTASLTAQINSALDSQAGTDDSGSAAAAHGRRVLTQDSDDW